MEKLTTLLIATPVFLAINFAQSMSDKHHLEKEYVSKDLTQCENLQYLCTPGKIPFTDHVGCGCMIELKSSMLKPDPSEIICTEQYDPVCGIVETYCIDPPCPREAKTFSNSCYAKKAGAINITKGPC
ncbi:MAG: hypothetical protein AB7J40_01370 [Candidatus Altimarinota bacterium]